MHPEIFEIGPIAIRSYGLMLALSFLFGLWYVWKVAKRDNKQFEQYLTIAYIMIFSGIIGARLFYVLFHLEEFASDWTATFNPFASDQFGIAGLNLYGGIVLAVIASFLYIRWRGLRVLDVFDYFAPTIGLGLIFGRLGCFFNGCCFGTPTELPWGITFPPDSIPYAIFQNAPLHPAQLYSSLYGALLFVFLHYVLKRRAFVGQVVALLFMIEAVFRFVIEYVRYYETEMHFHMFGVEPTWNQAIGVALFVLGLGIYFAQRRHRFSTT